MKLTSIAALALSVALTACVATPQNPQQAVFQTKQTYAATLTAAVAYTKLPRCATPVKQPCSDPAIVAQLRQADKVAEAALDSAENAVRTPGFGKDVVNTATAAATSALKALAAIVAQLGVSK